jgi:YD repeat-containing protein
LGEGLDGSPYTQPPGVTSKLVTVNGFYRVEERTGDVVEFNSSGQVSRRVDGDGNAVTFTYSGGKLQSVADGGGNAVTLTYNGDLVTRVADSTGRSVSFACDAANDLTTFTDAGGSEWRYTYDADGRMLTMQNPLEIWGVIATEWLPFNRSSCVD